MQQSEAPSEAPLIEEYERGSHLQRMALFLRNPRLSWEVLAHNERVGIAHCTRLLLVIAAIGPVCQVIGVWILAYVDPTLWHDRVALSIPIVIGLYVFRVLSTLVIVAAAWLLAPTFKAPRDVTQVLRVLVYAALPVCLGGILHLVPPVAKALALWPWAITYGDFIGQAQPLSILHGVLGLYSLYLAFVGIRATLGMTRSRSIMYLLVSALAGSIAGVLLVLSLEVLFGLGIWNLLTWPKPWMG